MTTETGGTPLIVGTALGAGSAGGGLTWAGVAVGGAESAEAAAPADGPPMASVPRALRVLLPSRRYNGSVDRLPNVEAMVQSCSCTRSETLPCALCKCLWRQTVRPRVRRCRAQCSRGRLCLSCPGVHGIVALPTLDITLSTPAVVYDLIAKYQVVEVRLPIVKLVAPAPATAAMF